MGGDQLSMTLPTSHTDTDIITNTPDITADLATTTATAASSAANESSTTNTASTGATVSKDATAATRATAAMTKAKATSTSPLLPNPQKLSLTVAMIAHNEQDRLPPTLAKIQDIAAEIVLINSVSTDTTIEVAQSFGATVYTEEFKGYVEQKNSLIPKCSQDWILFLDADEVLNDELKAAIVQVIKEDRHCSYEMNRLTFYLGKLLKHAWQPNYRLRLVRRDANPRWTGEIVHEALESDCPVERLPGYIIHYSYRNIHDHFIRTINYARMSAQSYIKRGKKCSLFKLIFSPFFSFIKLYFFNLGFLDGKVGYIAAQSAFVYTFLKYAFLWEANLKPTNAQELANMPMQSASTSPADTDSAAAATTTSATADSPAATGTTTTTANSTAAADSATKTETETSNTNAARS